MHMRWCRFSAVSLVNSICDVSNQQGKAYKSLANDKSSVAQPVGRTPLGDARYPQVGHKRKSLI